MVKMGNVWDRTVEVLNGRGGMLAGLALLSLFAPAALAAAFKSFAAPSTATLLASGLLTLGVTIAALWGQLAIIAASSDPATDRPAAIDAANRRVGPAIGIALLLALIFTIALLPAFFLFLGAGFDWTAISNGTPPAATAPGIAGVGVLYVLALGIALLFVGARLLPFYAVILHERCGIGTIARCWRLTRRHTWRLVGVVLLFVLVAGIATLAAQTVIGLLFRLMLGAGAAQAVAFAAAIAGQAVSTALTLVAIVFSAQLYLALVDRERRLRERAATPVAADDTWRDPA